MQVRDSASLASLTGLQEPDPKRISDLGFAVAEHAYDQTLLAAIHERAMVIRRQQSDDERHLLGLDHIRAAHKEIPEIADLMYDTERLAALSEISGTDLEPYPITRAASHINFYWPAKTPLAFHTDGAAMVELIPLYSDGTQSGGSTLLYRGPAEQGKRLLSATGRLPHERLTQIPQRVGRTVLLQGRMLLHTAETLADGHRVTLVLVLRSKAEPWKDDNSLLRLLLDDRFEDVHDEWIADLRERKLPAFRNATATDVN